MKAAQVVGSTRDLQVDGWYDPYHPASHPPVRCKEES